MSMSKEVVRVLLPVVNCPLTVNIFSYFFSDTRHRTMSGPLSSASHTRRTQTDVGFCGLTSIAQPEFTDNSETHSAKLGPCADVIVHVKFGAIEIKMTFDVFTCRCI